MWHRSGSEQTGITPPSQTSFLFIAFLCLCSLAASRPVVTSHRLDLGWTIIKFLPILLWRRGELAGRGEGGLTSCCKKITGVRTGLRTEDTAGILRERERTMMMRKYEKTIPARSGSHLGLSCLVSGDRTGPIFHDFSLLLSHCGRLAGINQLVGRACEGWAGWRHRNLKRMSGFRSSL